MDLKELREKRNKAIADARAVLDKADAEKRSLTTDEISSQTKMLTEARELGAQLRNAEELEVEERGIIPESQREERRRESPEVEQRRAEFRKFTTSKQMPLEIGENISIEVGGKSYNGRAYDLLPELRAQNTLSLGAGGAAVAPDTSMYGRIVEAIKWFGGIEAAGAEVFTTDTGADMPLATDNDTSNSGVIVAEEGSHASGTSVTMGSVTLHAYLFSSKVVKVSWQLLQDASFDIESYMGRKLGMRLGRALNTYCTTGTGVNQPQGLTVAAAVGRQSATGNTASVVADDVLRVIRSIDPGYLSGNCRFMTASATALAFELLKDGNGQYMWRSDGGVNGLTSASSFGPIAGYLRGYPVVLNNDMPALATSAKHTSFGDHSAYKIRRVRAIQLVRLNELYVENGQAGFLAFMRADGGLVDAGTNPVKLIQNSAS